jgi:3-hydroxybutyryl-CoA dehydrogenase
MGAGIAQVLVRGGVPVAVAEIDADIRSTVRARVVAGPDEGSSAHLLEVVGSIADAVDGVDLVIEAGPERVGIKRAIFEELGRRTSVNAILASNTSAIPIGEIARDVEAPERVIGTHFWNPPAAIRLVEVVRARASADWAIDAAVDLLERIGMSPVRVEVDTPGFVGNRLQHALKREAIALVAAGICSAETVDKVVRQGFGARLGIVGPLEQSDLSGTDLTLAIHDVVIPALDNTPTSHPYLVAMVARGDLGAKTGRGFRDWGPGEADRRRSEIARDLAAAARAREAL